MVKVKGNRGQRIMEKGEKGRRAGRRPFDKLRTGSREEGEGRKELL